MKRKIKTFNIIIVLVGFLVLGGCSSKYVVTFDSSPQGANLVCSGRNWGYTPRKLYYDKKVKKQDYLNVSDCSANWISGATKDYPQKLNIFPGGATIITLTRPDVDGYSQDAEFALKVQQMRYQKRQVEAAEAQAYEQAQQNFNKSMQNIKNNTPKTTTCHYYEWSKTTICN